MAKKKDISTKRALKANLWANRTASWSGYPAEEVKELLLTSRTQSVRLNTLNATVGMLSSYECELIDWAAPYGYSAPRVVIDQIRNSDLNNKGMVYIQNAASWLPVIALDPQPEETILDMCAAPGGKSSHIQAWTNNTSKLTCNDNSKPRLLRLQRNMKRLNAEAAYMLSDAIKISRLLDHESFDKILLDAPCSGEGLMTLHAKDEKLFDSWSVAHIRRLSDLQKKLILEAWRLLKPGGTLVYSTCTMAPEENEAVVDYLLKKQPDASLLPLELELDNRTPTVSEWNNRLYQHDLTNCLRLLPSQVTEAFFVAKITKAI